MADTIFRMIKPPVTSISGPDYLLGAVIHVDGDRQYQFACRDNISDTPLIPCQVGRDTLGIGSALEIKVLSTGVPELLRVNRFRGPLRAQTGSQQTYYECLADASAQAQVRFIDMLLTRPQQRLYRQNIDQETWDKYVQNVRFEVGISLNDLAANDPAQQYRQYNFLESPRTVLPSGRVQYVDEIMQVPKERPPEPAIEELDEAPPVGLSIDGLNNWIALLTERNTAARMADAMRVSVLDIQLRKLRKDAQQRLQLLRKKAHKPMHGRKIRSDDE